jgi:hypothetical protein
MAEGIADALTARGTAMTNATVHTTIISTHPASTGHRSALLRAGVVVGVIAAAANTAVVIAARAADVPLAVGGESIPLLGFPMMTLVATVIGVVFAMVLSIRSSRPRRTFVVTTMVLTAITLIPDASADATAATKLVLMLTHLVAAAIVIPALANRLEQ